MGEPARFFYTTDVPLTVVNGGKGPKFDPTPRDFLGAGQTLKSREPRAQGVARWKLERGGQRSVRVAALAGCMLGGVWGFRDLGILEFGGAAPLRNPMSARGTK